MEFNQVSLLFETLTTSWSVADFARNLDPDNLSPEIIGTVARFCLHVCAPCSDTINENYLLMNLIREVDHSKSVEPICTRFRVSILSENMQKKLYTKG